MQIAYISARPDVFFDTLSRVKEFMGFVTEIIVVVPESLADIYTSRASECNLIVHTDEAVTGKTRSDLNQLDHQALNYLVSGVAPGRDWYSCM